MSDFNVAALQSWVALNSKKVATKAVQNATTADLFIKNGSFQSGVKGTAGIMKINSIDVTFQDGASCGRTAAGNTVLGDKTITVKSIKDQQDVCPKTLESHFYSVFLNSGSAPENGIMEAFASQIMDYRTALIAAQNENLIWAGDTSLTGSTNMKYIDGIAKQVTGSTYISISSAATGTTLVEKLQAAYLAIPVEIRTQSDFRLFVGEDLYASYTVALANKNIYKPTDDFKLFGTTAIIQPTPGLNGSKQLFAARISNFQLGIDGVDDSHKAKLWFNEANDVWSLDYHWSIGVAVVYTEQVGFASGLN